MSSTAKTTAKARIRIPNIASFSRRCIFAMVLGAILVQGCHRGQGPPASSPSTVPQAVSSTVPAGSIEVSVIGFRNREGQLLASVFQSEGGFPNEPDKALRQEVVPISGDTVTLEFKGLPVGTYAVAVVHDENRNKTIDTGLFGLPKEGYGASRNPKPRLGAPLFKDCSFEWTGTEEKLEIRLQYLSSR
jgi:uncharacterized protein (DUF2141 family)